MTFYDLMKKIENANLIAGLSDRETIFFGVQIEIDGETLAKCEKYTQEDTIFLSWWELKQALILRKGYGLYVSFVNYEFEEEEMKGGILDFTIDGKPCWLAINARDLDE